MNERERERERASKRARETVFVGKFMHAFDVYFISDSLYARFQCGKSLQHSVLCECFE